MYCFLRLFRRRWLLLLFDIDKTEYMLFRLSVQCRTKVVGNYQEEYSWINLLVRISTIIPIQIPVLAMFSVNYEILVFQLLNYAYLGYDIFYFVNSLVQCTHTSEKERENLQENDRSHFGVNEQQ